MKAPIPFVEELRTELLTHAPGVQGSKLPFREHRGIRRGPLISVVAFAVVVAVGGTMWMLRPAGVGPDASAPPTGYISSITAGAEQIDGDPLLLRPASGPTPQFDPSTLGRNVPLTPSTRIDEIITWLGDDRDPTGPLFFIGHVEELGKDLVLGPSARFGYCSFVLDAVSSGAGCGLPTETDFGVTGAGAPPGYVTAYVPPETSVVVVTTEFGDPVWQQPVGGWALLPVESVEGNVAVDAYDHVGNLLGHWEW